MRKVSRTMAKGFTLIELAVVIAIVAILAAVAVPRLLDSTESAEYAVANDLASQLTSASSMYTAAYARTPTDFTSFVTAADLAAGDGKTISTKRVGNGTCAVGAAVINCTGAFTKMTSATYTWQEGAVVPKITSPQHP